ncbi:unnamed protein product [Dovyalis caffra]|uniref:Uncharacterized protein n=1 Tax=Dovyalis caffra TaxID=77055 RepID=A0AAV1QWW8_9ROSI|nr:unnamed protein product [Dovyalis caffra]
MEKPRPHQEDCGLGLKLQDNPYRYLMRSCCREDCGFLLEITGQSLSMFDAILLPSLGLNRIGFGYRRSVKLLLDKGAFPTHSMEQNFEFVFDWKAGEYRAGKLLNIEVDHIMDYVFASSEGAPKALADVVKLVTGDCRLQLKDIFSMSSHLVAELSKECEQLKDFLFCYVDVRDVALLLTLKTCGRDLLNNSAALVSNLGEGLFASVRYAAAFAGQGGIPNSLYVVIDDGIFSARELLSHLDIFIMSSHLVAELSKECEQLKEFLFCYDVRDVALLPTFKTCSRFDLLFQKLCFSRSA